MHYLFENADILKTPFECFYFDTSKECFPVKPHWHYYAEMIYIIEGCAEMQCGEKNYILSENEMIFFHPQTVHSIYSAGGKKLFYAVIKFDINQLDMSPQYAPKLRSIFRSAEKMNMQIMFPSSLCAELNAKAVFETCVDEIQNHRYANDIVVKSRLYELLTRLIRIWQSCGFSINGEVFAEDNHFDINNITAYIDSRICDGVTATDIAKQCRMSYSYFAKKFLSVYGKTCKEYIEEMRIYKAEEFLLYTDFDLSYISQETGFSDCSHMIKSFKRYKGVTPKKFRMERKFRA